MDTLAHVVYGATLCSRSGLAGGLNTPTGAGGRIRWYRDWTVWAAVFFGILPDLVAFGPHALAYGLNGGGGQAVYWRSIQADTMVRYYWMHSLVLSLSVASLLRWRRKAWFVPSLAWSVHIIMDALTHGSGRFQTTIFYPFTTWGLDSIRWWEHPRLIQVYWLFLPACWAWLAWQRRRRGTAQSSST